MARKKEPPGVSLYYETLRQIFELQSKILTAVIPHAGERGRNDEERFRDFLVKVLPKKFSVGTGTIICSDPAIPSSSQTDVVIFDEIQNSPLHRELAAFVYPIEMVYGTIEVKGLLKQSDLKKSLVDIGKIRALGKNRWYLKYDSAPKRPEKPNQKIVTKNEFQRTLPPRSFIFAYDTNDWKTLDGFTKSLRKALVENGKAHLHGIAVLSKDWFAYQEAFGEGGVEIKNFSDNCLLRFVNELLHDISSMRIYQMAVDRYMKL